jgi:hypothetical protein
LSVSRVQRYDLKKLKTLVEKPVVGKWKTYADDEWFRRHESNCETMLAEFFASVAPNIKPEEWGREPWIDKINKMSVSKSA